MFKENTLVNKVLFFILLVLCLTPFISIPVALFMGLAFALVFKNPYPEESVQIPAPVFRCRAWFRHEYV